MQISIFNLQDSHSIDHQNGQYIVIGKVVHQSPLNEQQGSEIHENSSSRGSFPFSDLEGMPPRRHDITWLIPGEELHLGSLIILIFII